MAGLKVYVRRDVEERFSGYGRSSISRAAEDAFLMWMMHHEAALKEVNV